jgi:hypothetical protein
LRNLIADLPMRSPALKITLREVSLMSDASFERWLKRIDESAKRCLELYQNEKQWSRLTEGAVPGDDQYGFFRLSALP